MTEESKLLNISKKGVPVTILGLKNAGKTTLLNWMREKRFTRPKTTIGYKFEQVEIDDVLFNVFDLSGHLSFRETMWKFFVQSSIGIIFILDSSDTKQLQESAHWFWNIVDNWLKEIYSECVVLFLANKSDLKKSLDLEHIINIFELEKMAIYPNISFQIFKTSIRRGENLDLALKWFTSRIDKISQLQTAKVQAVIISDNLGNLLYSYDPNKIAFDSELLAGFLKAMCSFTDEALGTEQLKLVKIDTYFILISKEEKYNISIITDDEQNLPELRRIARRIYHEILNYPKKTLNSEDYQKIITALI
ncbi:MAG: ADP-ribosylation factor-like protein [Candidatus Heimdallarchaeaceae archaeon]